MRFPVEVLVDKKGVCSEKSMLLAGILAYAGYDVVLFEFEKENHMAVGIKCSCKNSFRNSGYCFIEAARIQPIGFPAEVYDGVLENITLESEPLIIYREDLTRNILNNETYLPYGYSSGVAWYIPIS